MTDTAPQDVSLSLLKEALACLDVELESELALYRRQRSQLQTELLAIANVPERVDQVNAAPELAETACISPSSDPTDTHPSKEPVVTTPVEAGDDHLPAAPETEVEAEVETELETVDFEGISLAEPPADVSPQRNPELPSDATPIAAPQPPQIETEEQGQDLRADNPRANNPDEAELDSEDLEPEPLELAEEVLPVPFGTKLSELPQSFDDYLDPSIDDYLESSETLLRHLESSPSPGETEDSVEQLTQRAWVIGFRIVLACIVLGIVVWLLSSLIPQWFKPQKTDPQPSPSPTQDLTQPTP